MSDHAPGLDRAMQLREAFDRSFAREPAGETAATDEFLTVTIGADRYALRLAEVAGLYADKPVTWLPSAVSELVGIAGFRGTVMPVYDLGALLGYPRASTARWLLLAAAAPVALAFERFDGYLNLKGAVVLPQAHARGDHLRETLQSDEVRPIIHVPSVLNTIRDRIGQDRPI